MATLYELDNAIANFEFEIDEETGEILNADDLDKLELEREKKIENVALWYKNLKSDAEAYKREKDLFAEKERVTKNKMESLKSYLNYALHGETFKAESGRVQVTYRKSKSVEVASEFDDERFLIPQEPKVDKTAIKKAIESGEEIVGATIIEKQNIQIK